MATTEPNYTHIVHHSDAMVSHTGSASGWDLKSRHAANKTKDGEFLTICGKIMKIDNEDYYHHDGEIEKEKASRFQARITCKRCLKRLIREVW